MATYDELRAITGSASGDALRARVVVAVAIKAQELIDGAPSPGQLAWATEALADPGSKATTVLNYMIAKNNGAALATITGASDAVIQTNANAAIAALVA